MELPPFVTFLDGNNMTDFWQTVKLFLFYIAPVFMIWVAVELVGWIIRTVRNTVDDEDTGRRHRYHDDDDDDYYYYRD